MKVVSKAENFPGRCLVTASTQGPYVDFQSNYDDLAIYLHTAVIEQAADLLGYVPKERFEELREQIAAWCEECNRLRERVAALETIKRLDDEIREEVAA